MPPVRRLAAILAADVVGYSRLMGLDEAGTVQALREHRAAADPLITLHGGRIVKTTGDGILIEFGSVVGAVECALALQRLAADLNATISDERRMEWRIGVHLGDVLIEGDDILGDGVNIAARLEGIAEPGGICISEDAFRQVRGKVEVEFADLGEQTLKNIARPLRVYRVGPSGAARQPTSPASALPLPDKPSVFDFGDDKKGSLIFSSTATTCKRPQCGKLMKRFQYRAYDLEMDFCEDGHGYWLDEEGDKRVLELMKKEEVGLERKVLAEDRWASYLQHLRPGSFLDKVLDLFFR